MSIQPILYYPFDNDIKNYAVSTLGAFDASLNGINCLISNVHSKWGSGSLQHINNDISSFFKINKTIKNTNGYSFAFWIKFINLNTSTMVFDFTVTNANDTNNRIFMWFNSNNYLYVGTSRWDFFENRILSPQVDKWYYLVWTLAKDNTSNVYLDGNLIRTFTDVPYINPTFVNNYIFHAPNGVGFSGVNAYVDDFRYFDGILSPYQVEKLYTSNSYEEYVACLLEGTKVWTCNGYVPIETLKVGDSIRTRKFDIAITKVGKWSVDMSNPTDVANLSNKMYKIPAGLYGATSDVYISHYHRFMFESEPSDDNFKRLMGIPEQVGLQPAPVSEFAKDGKYNIYHLQLALGNHYVVNGGCMVEAWEKDANFF